MPRNSLSYQAGLAREKAQRRIRNLQAGIKSGKYRGQLQQEAQQQIKDLKRYMQQTRMKDNTGRVIKSHTEQFRREALERLERMNVNASYAVRQSYDFTNYQFVKQQMRLSSYEASPVFSKTEIQVFMRATQRAWERRDAEGKLLYSSDKRNEAIMDYFGIEPKDFGKFMQAVIAKNRGIIDVIEKMRKDKRVNKNADAKAREQDTGDEDKPSPEWFNVVEIYTKETAPVINA